MSKIALQTLRDFWHNIEFSTVKKTVVHDNDLMYVRVDDEYHGKHYNSLDAVPQDDLNKAKLVWRRYHGYDVNGVIFHNSSYQELDLDIDFTMCPSKWGNHTSGKFRLPEIGTLIAGEISNDCYRWWFTCNQETKTLIDMVMGRVPIASDHELGKLLLTCGHPDKLWAIARLVFHDNVKPFISQFKESEMPKHPMYGNPGKCIDRHGRPFDILHSGMWLTTSVDKLVHTLGYQLGEPNWWQEFKQAVGNVREHHDYGDWCKACAAEHPIEYYDY